MDLSFLKKQLEWALAQIEQLKKLQKPMPTQTANGIKIYEMAKSLLNTDASPKDVAPDYLGCAETVNEIVRRATGQPVGGGVSTHEMCKVLMNTPSRWKQVLNPLPGDIIISPSWWVQGAKLKHGHVGVVGYHGVISNNSENGLLGMTHSIRAWIAYYTEFGGLPTFYFRCL
jgi:hypothetical protein